METRVLRVFSAVARHGGLAKAALELHLTPSALSHAIKDLESELGCRLFERVGKQLILNQAGEQLQAGIQDPLQMLERTAAAVRDLARWGQGRLRVGAPASACQFLLPSVIRALRQESPRMHLAVESGDMPQLVVLLRERRIDLALGVEPETANDLEHRTVFEDELFLTFSSAHAWSAGPAPGPRDIARQTLIFYQRLGPTARLITQYLRDHGCEPGSTMAIASIPAIKEMVRLDLGIAVLAPWVAEGELTRGTLRMRPLGAKALKRRWVVAHLSGRPLDLGEERFCRLCRSQATALRKMRKDLPTLLPSPDSGATPQNSGGAEGASPA